MVFSSARSTTPFKMERAAAFLITLVFSMKRKIRLLNSKRRSRISKRDSEEQENGRMILRMR
jgi:hypothetical protein